MSVLSSELPEPLRLFFDYWHSLPKTGLLPKLADFFDSVPPAVAPYLVVADILAPEDTRLRFFGTRLVERAEFDPTGLPVAALYAESLRKRIHEVMWTCVRRPAGYVLRRTVVVRSGFLNENLSLGLPVEIPTSNLRAVMAFTHGTAEVRMIDRGEDTLVQEMKFERWVDLGAGTP
ncbi:MAG: hypothetical protein IT566_00140 [Rhodospirillaceae bacterium]|nr:hypothetical protein [Rhodospirillaceae bacterium]